MTGVLKGGVETGTQGEHHVTTEAGVGVRPLQAKEPPGLLAITGSWKRWESILPRVSEGGWPH